MQTLLWLSRIQEAMPPMSLEREFRLRFQGVGDDKGGLLFPARHPPRVLGKSAKHQPRSEDILREPICNVLLHALSHNPVVNF
jgi:hypothetical protein